MKKEDKKEFGKILVVTGEIYDKQITASLIKVYFEVLKDYTLDELKRALELHIKDREEGKFFPRPSNFINQIEADEGVLAILAWDKAYKGIKQGAYYDTMIFDDPVIHMVITQMGGWIEFSDLLIKDTPYRRAEFIKLYKHFQKHPIDAPKRLAGFHEMNNRREGYLKDIPEPLMITGDKKALKEGEK